MGSSATKRVIREQKFWAASAACGLETCGGCHSQRCTTTSRRTPGAARRSTTTRSGSSRVATDTRPGLGPGGATPMKPVGTVHLATARANQSVLHRHEFFDLDSRWDIQMAAVQTALELLSDRLR